MNEPRESRSINVVHHRQPSDNYATGFEIAKWTVDHCAELSDKHSDRNYGKLTMLEPGCGDNAPFSRYAATLGMNCYATDIRNVAQRETVVVMNNMDFLQLPCEENASLYSRQYDVIATNPPFNVGAEFIIRSLDILSPFGIAAFVVKLTFLGSMKRHELLFRDRPPIEIHELVNRPSFAYGATDRGQEYCILIWGGTELEKKLRRNRGRVPRFYWQINKEWPVPVLPDGKGTRIMVEKFEP